MNARDDLSDLQRTIAGLHRTIAAELPAAAGALAAARQLRADIRSGVAAEVQSRASAARPEVVAPWGDCSWQGWVPNPHQPAELRVGTALLAGTALPATLPAFGGQSVIVTSRGQEAADHAGVVLLNLAVRAAAAAGRGVVLHLIDPHREGFGFPERGDLPNAAPRTSNVVTDLSAVVEACHSRGAGRRATTLHLVLALDYPRGYTYGASEALNWIARLAPAGAHLVLHHDLDAPLGTGRELDIVDPVVVEVHADGAAFGAWGPASVTLDGPPPRDVVDKVAATMPAESSAPQRLVHWTDLSSDDPATWWRSSARLEARAPVALGPDERPVEFAFGIDRDGESHAHAVIGGQAGSGKSMLLHTLITALATRYSPDELRFYLLDGQDGAEMQVHRDLPHADVVTLRTPDELLRGVLVDVSAELDRRNALLVAHGRSSLSELDDAVRPPRLLIVIDEYQRLLRGADQGAITMLQDIAAQGRKVGIHLVLASQRFHATGLLNQDALFANVRTRISLAMASDSLAGIDEFKAEGRHLIASHCTAAGRVVVNDSGGADGANHIGQTAFQDYDDLRALVARLAEEESTLHPILIDGAVQPSASDNRALAGLAKAGGRPSDLVAWARAAARDGGLGGVSDWQLYDQPFAFVVGRTYSVYGSAAAVVRRADGANVLALTADAEVLSGILQTGLASAALSAPVGSLTVSVLAHLPSPVGVSWRGALSQTLVDLLALRGDTVRVASEDTEAVALLEEAVAEATRRGGLSSDELAECGPHLVVAAGLERVRPFRTVETKYGPEPSAAGRALRQLALDGPRVGVHVVLGATSRQAWGQVLPDKAARAFQHRFYQQMSEQDANALLESLAPSKVGRATGLGGGTGPRGAGYQDAVAARTEVFMPYVTGPDLTTALRALLTGVAR